MCYFGIIRDRHILLMHTVGPIACAVLSGGCSAVGEHTVLFLCLCHVDSKGCHEAAILRKSDYWIHRTLMIWRDRLVPKLILVLGLLWSISLSLV